MPKQSFKKKYNLTHNLKVKGFQTFSQCISPKVNPLERLEFELTTISQSTAITVTLRRHTLLNMVD